MGRGRAGREADRGRARGPGPGQMRSRISRRGVRTCTLNQFAWLNLIHLKTYNKIDVMTVRSVRRSHSSCPALMLLATCLLALSLPASAVSTMGSCLCIKVSSLLPAGVLALASGVDPYDW